MADKGPSSLTAAATLTGTEVVHVVQGGNSRKTTTQDIGNLGTGFAISDVTGLQDALDLKLDDSQAEATGLSVLGAASESAARAAIGAVIGSDVQAFDADLDAIAALSTTSYGRSLLTLADQAALQAEAAGAGTDYGWTMIDSASASASSNIDFAINSASYDEWLLIGSAVILSGANELNMQVGTGGGPSLDTGNNYDFAIDWSYGTSGAGTSSRAFVSATSSIRLATLASVSSPSGIPMDFDCKLKYLASGSPMRVFKGSGNYDGSAGLTESWFKGVHNNSAYDVSGIRIAPSAGTITSGLFALYGRTLP